MEAAEPAASPTGATTTGPKGITEAPRLTPIAVAGRGTLVVISATRLTPRKGRYLLALLHQDPVPGTAKRGSGRTSSCAASPGPPPA